MDLRLARCLVQAKCLEIHSVTIWGTLVHTGFTRGDRVGSCDVRVVMNFVGKRPEDACHFVALGDVSIGRIR